MSNWTSGGLGAGLHGEHLLCRRCSSFEGGLQAGRWTLHDEEPKFAPDRTCDVEHLKLEVDVDLPKQTVEARATLTLAAAYGPFDEVVLDAVDLEIRSVKDGKGRALKYSYLDRKLRVSFKPKVKDRIDLIIDYRVHRPSGGLYFMGPSEAEPKATWQLWSQGEDEEARHWIPCHDAPHERMTTEILATAAANLTVVSNGELLSVKPRGKKKTWHYREATAYPSYLISLVIGEFVKVEDRWRRCQSSTSSSQRTRRRLGAPSARRPRCSTSSPTCSTTPIRTRSTRRWRCGTSPSAAWKT
ncbi:MAG: hypothetical protein U0527_06450 [Candidatus Eisenbacteria bacterium]